MLPVFREAVQITSFVTIMMMIVEYAHVRTQGKWQQYLVRNRISQYVLASLLGAVPGCLGAFAVVTLYTHGGLTLGALVAAMIATAGDESFVMFAMVPNKALAIHAALWVIGILTGVVTDLVCRTPHRTGTPDCTEMTLHDACCETTSHADVHRWKECSVSRCVLALTLLILFVAFATGKMGPSSWNWLRITLLISLAVALWMVATASDHFLKEHFWHHVVRRHVPRGLLWTLGALVVLWWLEPRMDLSILSGQAEWLLLGAAVVIGLIPESGPHMVFVTLFAQGVIPLSVLMANSIVQDGHGMLPLLAQSRHSFFTVKAINLSVGLAVGLLLMALGY